MTRRSPLHPRWWPWHLALVVVLVSFGWLGWWQLSSFEDSAPARPTQAKAADLDAVTSPGGRLDAGDIGRVVVTRGQWQPEGQLLVPDRARRGQQGVLVVTPLRTPAGVLPVVRGWAASAAAAPVPPAGTVTVTGVLQRSETEADASAVTGTLPPGQVPYVATVTLLSVLPYSPAELYDGFAVLRSQDPAAADAPALVAARETSAPEPVGRWRNLAYALQWWVFAGAAVVFWAMVLRRETRDPRESARAGDEPHAALPAPRRTT